MITKVKLKKGPGYEYINLDQITRIDILPNRYQIVMADRWSFFADKTDTIITGLIAAADA